MVETVSNPGVTPFIVRIGDFQKLPYRVEENPGRLRELCLLAGMNDAEIAATKLIVAPEPSAATREIKLREDEAILLFVDPRSGEERNETVAPGCLSEKLNMILAQQVYERSRLGLAKSARKQSGKEILSRIVFSSGKREMREFLEKARQLPPVITVF
ncbi:MAG: hypothetical protein ABSE17_03530 [Candidatus Levyibacteriota bacterium]|jgi:hypothetical protein